MADTRPLFIRCAHCDKKVPVSPTGRVPVFCGNNCRQKTFTKGVRATMHESQHRQMTWRLLQDAGLVPVDQPPPKLER